MPNWSDGEGGCGCPSGHAAGLGFHREGEPGCVSGPELVKSEADLKKKQKRVLHILHDLRRDLASVRHERVVLLNNILGGVLKDLEAIFATPTARAELLEALRIEPCHTTGQHDPRHTPQYICELQRAKSFTRALELLGIAEEELPKRLHENCGWCHDVPSQEEYRIGNRELHAWAGVPISPELAAPGSGAERYTDEYVLEWLRKTESPSLRRLYHGTIYHGIVSRLVGAGKARWTDEKKTIAEAT